MTRAVKALALPAAVLLFLVIVNVIVPFRGWSWLHPFPSDHPILGIYDPRAAFGQDHRFRIDHVFIGWLGESDLELRRASQQARSRRRDLVVTFEPWATQDTTHGDDYVRAILSGQFDANIGKFCRELGRLEPVPLLRWAHEMEVPSTRYAWAGLKPYDYIEIFRYFVRSCREHSPHAKFMWSPRGESGLEHYFPGESFVDAIGISVFGLEGWEQRMFGSARSFNEALAEKYTRVEAFKKPVYVAEFGVSGTEDYRRSWISQTVQRQEQTFPLLVGILYFNEVEPYVWPDGFGSPDWRIDRP
jgi:endoglucanase